MKDVQSMERDGDVFSDDSLKRTHMMNEVTR